MPRPVSGLRPPLASARSDPVYREPRIAQRGCRRVPLEMVARVQVRSRHR